MPKIEELLAYISDEGDGDEGVVAAKLGDSWMPLIGADRDRMESLRHIAKDTAKMSGRPVRLVRFSTLEEMGEA